MIDKTVKPMNVRSFSVFYSSLIALNINTKTVKLKFLHRALVLINAYKCAKF